MIDYYLMYVMDLCVLRIYVHAFNCECVCVCVLNSNETIIPPARGVRRMPAQGNKLVKREEKKSNINNIICLNRSQRERLELFVFFLHIYINTILFVADCDGDR